MNKKISVIISVYNGADYLDDAVQSVLNQNWDNLEIIIIDDKSKDNSREIISKYEGDSRFIIKYNEYNLGLNKNLQIGIDMASGDYICLLGQDDLFAESKFEKQIKFIEENNFDAVYAGTMEVNSEGIPFEVQPSMDNFEKIYNQNREKLLEVVCTAPSNVYLPMGQSAMYKAHVLKELNPLRAKLLLDDWPLLMKIVESYNFGFMNEAMFKYRKHSTNMTTDNRYIKSISMQAAIMTIPDKYINQYFVNNMLSCAYSCFSNDDYKKAFKYSLHIMILKPDFKNFKFIVKCIRRYLRYKLKNC